jgi:hypothetical protein
MAYCSWEEEWHEPGRPRRSAGFAVGESAWRDTPCGWDSGCLKHVTCAGPEAVARRAGSGLRLAPSPRWTVEKDLYGIQNVPAENPMVPLDHEELATEVVTKKRHTEIDRWQS